MWRRDSVMQADLGKIFDICRAIGARDVIGIELRLQQQKRGDAAHHGRRVKPMRANPTRTIKLWAALAWKGLCKRSVGEEKRRLQAVV